MSTESSFFIGLGDLFQAHVVIGSIHVPLWLQDQASPFTTLTVGGCSQFLEATLVPEHGSVVLSQQENFSFQTTKTASYIIISHHHGSDYHSTFTGLAFIQVQAPHTGGRIPRGHRRILLTILLQAPASTISRKWSLLVLRK